MGQKISVNFRVNGKPYAIVVEAYWTLLDVLRNTLGLKGTKYGCGTGECGCCTVLLDGKPVASCLTLAADVQGGHVVTIEGVSIEGLSLLQEKFVEYGAVQCGYCSPGFILCAKALLGEVPNPTELEIRRYLRGNLCRCTGYAKIVKAVKVVARVQRRRRVA